MVKDNTVQEEYTYNYLNLLQKVSNFDNPSPKLQYRWLADGSKCGYTDGSSLNGQEYLGSLIYNRQNGALSLDVAQFGDGVIKPGSGGQEIDYFYRDHLGSVRCIAQSTGVVKQRNDYYPFGLKMTKSNYETNGNKFLFNGKELQDETSDSFYDYGARMYNPVYGRWMTIDPLAEKYPAVSPLAYCMNNPIMLTDPTGMIVDMSQILAYDQANNTNYAQKIMDDLNSQTGMTFSINSSGQMDYKKDDDGNAVVKTDENGNQIGSATARGIMTGAIDSKETARASIGTGKSETGNHNDMSLSPKEINETIAGAHNVDSRTNGYGMTFMHELSHTGPGGGLKDTPNEQTTGKAPNPWPVEARLNQVRAELDAQGGSYDKGRLIRHSNRILVLLVIYRFRLMGRNK